jgi:hypothetical protein
MTVPRMLAVAAAAVVLAAPADATAAPHRCSKKIDLQDTLGAHATILSVREMRCRAARRAVRRHGRAARDDAYGPVGSTFDLGPWTCTVTYSLEEAHRARCTRGGRSFRVDYGS